MEYLKLTMCLVMAGFVLSINYMIYKDKLVINTETSKIDKAIVMLFYVAAFSAFTTEALYIFAELIK